MAARGGRPAAVPLRQAYRLFGVNPVVMVTTVGKDGRPNVMTCAWCTPYDFSPPQLLLVIDRAALTFANLRATGKFTVNIVPAGMATAAVRCGSVSGRAGDKFARFKLATVPAKKNGVPALAGALAWLECVLTDRTLLRRGIVAGRGVYAAAQPGVFAAGAWRPAAAARVLHHLGGSAFLTGGRRLTIAP